MIRARPFIMHPMALAQLAQWQVAQLTLLWLWMWSCITCSCFDIALSGHLQWLQWYYCSGSCRNWNANLAKTPSLARSHRKSVKVLSLFSFNSTIHREDKSKNLLAKIFSFGNFIIVMNTKSSIEMLLKFSEHFQTAVYSLLGVST